MPNSVSTRVQKHRDGLRAAGLRPIQIWVPDTRRPGFAAECRRQAAIASRSDDADVTLNDFLNTALDEMDGWD
ncbi:DUF3018 family protein [Paracoccus subflavus]|uniref:DUF3018 family protein n=1 Tax=Paracoccus subflavus TaxID=2528244 RepID=A0A4Q9G5V5_9RHOB|nr:antitoxin MazE family protein [Paracoccus subflavus]TBN42623.1 DUF3018 family protein [Paracoccus subflavus]